MVPAGVDRPKRVNLWLLAALLFCLGAWLAIAFGLHALL